MSYVSSRLIGPLLAGLGFAFLTWLVIGDHPQPDLIGTPFAWLLYPVIILLLPGFVTGFAISNNIHFAETWIVASGNFIFYFGLTYLIGRFREKRRAKIQSATSELLHPTSKS